MSERYIQFLNIWHEVMHYAIFVAIGLGIIYLLQYYVRLSGIKDPKEKFDFIQTKESKTLLGTLIFFCAALLFYLNTIKKQTVEIDVIWFFVRFFVTFCISTLIVYIGTLLLKYVYPANRERRLKKLRYQPRISPAGNVMKLLSEEEEDVHLDEGMQAEEAVFSVDYDVWVDDKTGYVKIEKYKGHLQVKQCNSCGFYTMKAVREEVKEAPTQTTEGTMIKHYECSYCGSQRHEERHIAKLEDDQKEYKIPEHAKYRERTEIQGITLELHLSGGTTKSFEFQSPSQAKNFLDEYQNKLKEENKYLA